MSDFDRFDALSFDCYGTLIDWEAGIVAGLERWLAGHGAAIPRDELLTAYAAIESGEQQDRPELYPRILERVIRRLGERFGVEVSDADAATFGASVPDWPAFPDSPEALARLQRRFKLIILSNVDRASFAHSNERLAVTFDAIVTAEDVGTYKPDPRNFDALFETANGLGVAKERLLHVAQSLFHDHVPGQAAGLQTVWIDRYGGAGGATPPPSVDVRPTWTFRSLGAFADAGEADVGAVEADATRSDRAG